MASLMHATVKEASKLVARQASQSNDPNIGSAQKGSNSVSTVVSTLVPVLLFALVWFTLFLVLRSKLPRNYRPRTFLGSLRQNERSPSLPTGLFNWFGAFFSLPDTYVLNHHSLDGFLFLRLLKISVVTCFVGCLITWPVLFPVNATGGGGQTQFDLLTMGNVTNSYYRYFAHAGCAYLFFGRAYQSSPGIPDVSLLLQSAFLARIWVVSDVKDLEDLVEERDKVAMKLEAAETKLIKLANAARVKEERKGGARHDSEEAVIGPNAASGSMAARYIKPKQRPTHRLKPLIGKKVDTIDWSRNELQKLIPKVDKLQAEHRAGDAKYLNSVFVEFETLSDAQAAYQSLTHHQVLHMAPRYTGISPEEVIWKNLRIKWWERVMRVIVTTSFVVALIIFWSIPVAVVASISNINALIGLLPWLSFLNKIPSVILGVVTGLLPTILLAVLMALLPIVLRLSAKLGGDPSLSAVELTVQNSYFGFQVVQVFLVATLGSAASASVNTIVKDPTSVTTLLAKQIPKASNFYLAYFVLQGLGVVSSLLVGLVGLIVFFVLGKLLDKTPRKMYKRWVQLSGVGWGTVFPIYTNLFVIAICYACIAPSVLAFAAIGLWFFYFAYRYNLLFVSNANIDTKGLVYPRALQQLFVGLYVAELCLIGLFAIKAGTPGAIGPLILMIILLVFTALYHISLNAAIDPLMKYLPKSLDAEERRLLDIENGGETGTLVDDESGYRKEHLGVQNARTHGADAEGLGPAPHKKPNFLTKFLRPDVYTDYATMRRLVPKDVVVQYEPEIERDAYFNPAIKSRTPLLWIPRDAAGVSRQEVNDTSKVIPITDEGAFFDEKNRITWDAEGGRPPIWEPKVYY
ncbi:hypothetical protein B0A49_06414 [Cryomyces minteri]|uniref:CSC1/OSCA1-like 7TM region domain-containing protein n=1 Tax=Cryomyces minteri TaxID=331657 RepID=A0A4U0X075_9PEZI|nr:hypothetical protein B0A49_06414 [Cryomyces minteri]